MFNRMLGGILLIVGTSIGGGMLALPVVAAQTGFFTACGLMIGVWALMTLSALWILEVNLWLPAGSNLISMAKATLGVGGAAIAWLAYLLLLYCLLSVYIAGGADVIASIFSNLHIRPFASVLVFIFILGAVVACGVRSVDWVNRGLLSIKLASFVLLVGLTFPYIQFSRLIHIKVALLSIAIMPVITSFGYAIIIPSLRVYLHSDRIRLRRMIIFSSLLPLFCYLLWVFVTLGAVSLTGAHGLVHMLNSGHAASELMQALGAISHTSVIDHLSNLFTAICVGTSFLGVSLAMCHFLHDGLAVPVTNPGKILILGIAYLPPMLLVLFFPNVFIMGLHYAGICCVVLLMLLPALMVYVGRYHKPQLSQETQPLGGSKPVVLLVAAVALALIIFELFH